MKRSSSALRASSSLLAAASRRPRSRASATALRMSATSRRAATAVTSRMIVMVIAGSQPSLPVNGVGTTPVSSSRTSTSTDSTLSPVVAISSRASSVSAAIRITTGYSSAARSWAPWPSSIIAWIAQTRIDSVTRAAAWTRWRRSSHRTTASSAASSSGVSAVRTRPSARFASPPRAPPEMPAHTETRRLRATRARSSSVLAGAARAWRSRRPASASVAMRAQDTVSSARRRAVAPAAAEDP